jgi:hypothetical protein
MDDGADAPGGVICAKSSRWNLGARRELPFAIQEGFIDAEHHRRQRNLSIAQSGRSGRSPSGIERLCPQQHRSSTP